MFVLVLLLIVNAKREYSPYSKNYETNYFYVSQDSFKTFQSQALRVINKSSYINFLSILMFILRSTRIESMS